MQEILNRKKSTSQSSLIFNPFRMTRGKNGNAELRILAISVQSFRTCFGISNITHWSISLFERLETLKRVQGDIKDVLSFRTCFGISNITHWSIQGDSNLVIFIPNICTNIFKLWIDTFFQVDFPLTMPIFQLFFSV